MDKVSQAFLVAFIVGSVAITAYATQCLVPIHASGVHTLDISSIVSHIPPNSTPVYALNGTLYVYVSGKYCVLENNSLSIKNCNHPKYPPMPVGYISNGKLHMLFKLSHS